MKSLTDVVSGAGLAGYAEIALLIFFLVFVAIGLRVLMSATTSFSDAAKLPLDDGARVQRPTVGAHNPARREERANDPR